MKKIINFINENKNYSVVIIRITLALVLLWFGINQIFIPDNFLGYVPPWAMPDHMHMLHFPVAGVNTIILFNGILETVIGIFLLLGYYTRIFAFIAAVHLLIITVSLGYNDVAIRDFGLTMMAVSLIFSGAGSFSLDKKKN
tara:strand:+ start:5046 stop:5468 length:423 start_codon:yes stop_codon:yes gene_type:complete